MKPSTAIAIAHPNIALIKYWGNRDDSLRLPANGSISMNLEQLHTRTKVTWQAGRQLKHGDSQTLIINGNTITGAGLQRVAEFLDLVRAMAGVAGDAVVETRNNFPAGAGIASSASAFAALALAATRAAGLDLTEMELSRLARRGSGSACRSIPDGFVEWKMGNGDADSYAVSLAPAQYWALIDVIAIISTAHKPTGSTEGHALAGTSPLQAARVADAPHRLELCRTAIRQRDFAALAEVTERDSMLMHAVMMTSTPGLFYRQEASLSVIKEVRKARTRGLAACTTVDAGPNVHVICEQEAAPDVVHLVRDIPGVIETRMAKVGGATRLVKDH